MIPLFSILFIAICVVFCLYFIYWLWQKTKHSFLFSLKHCRKKKVCKELYQSICKQKTQINILQVNYYKAHFCTDTSIRNQKLHSIATCIIPLAKQLREECTRCLYTYHDYLSSTQIVELGDILKKSYDILENVKKEENL